MLFSEIPVKMVERDYWFRNPRRRSLFFCYDNLWNVSYNKKSQYRSICRFLKNFKDTLPCCNSPYKGGRLKNHEKSIKMRKEALHHILLNCVQAIRAQCSIAIPMSRNFWAQEVKNNRAFFNHNAIYEVIQELIQGGWLCVESGYHKAESKIEDSFTRTYAPSDKLISAFYHNDKTVFCSVNKPERRQKKERVYLKSYDKKSKVPFVDIPCLNFSYKRNLDINSEQSINACRNLSFKELNAKAVIHNVSKKQWASLTLSQKTRVLQSVLRGEIYPVSFVIQGSVYPASKILDKFGNILLKVYPYRSKEQTTNTIIRTECNHAEDNEILVMPRPLATFEDEAVKELKIEAISYGINENEMFRVFNGDNLRGGRWYGSVVQCLPKVLRRNLTYEGQPMVELDYVAQHVAIAYDLEGLDAVQNPYIHTGKKRDEIKAAMLIAINAPNRQNAVQAIRYKFRKDFGYKNNSKLSDAYIEDLLAEIEDYHKPIKGYFYNDSWAVLQGIDSCIATEIMLQYRNDCVSALFCIHDSFIVPKWHAKRLREIMVEKYQKVLKTKRQPQIKQCE